MMPDWRCERWRHPFTPTKPSEESRNMPPVRMPVSPAFVIVTMMIEPTEPTIGSSDEMRPPPPSDGAISGGGCTCTLPDGILGGASRVPATTRHRPR
jgi:hypothetical protein